MSQTDSSAQIDALLTQIETQLGQIQAALQQSDPSALEAPSLDLHRSLGELMNAASQSGDLSLLPIGLRQRLAAIAGQVGTQREWLARAAAQVDRNLNALLQPHAPAASTYSSQGTTGKPRSGGSIVA